MSKWLTPKSFTSQITQLVWIKFSMLAGLSPVILLEVTNSDFAWEEQGGEENYEIRIYTSTNEVHEVKPNSEKSVLFVPWRHRVLAQKFIALQESKGFRGRVRFHLNGLQLLRLESELQIVPDFRLGNRKRYYQSSIEAQLKKLRT